MMKKIIIVVGPTGAGKSALSVKLAKYFNGEIISGDAYQVYKEMSIGSAKIKAEEMEGIPHYLVDYCSYDEEYNVKIFQEEGRKYIDEIYKKGKIPIVCGGTGLYIKALLYDYVFEEEEVDERYLKMLQSKTNEELYALLEEVDKLSLETIHPNNRQRMIRALMMAHSGTKKSDRLSSQDHKPLYDAYVIGVSMDREILYERINERVLKMMEEGLLSEIETLVKDEQVFALQSMKGIGYKEWKNYFNKEATLEETIALIQKNSRNFAKRQYTWFRNQMNVHWYDMNQEGIKEDIIQDVSCFLGKDDESKIN